jgi:hypothetical protein
MRKATRRHPIHAGRVLVSRLVLPHPRDSSVDGVQSAAVYNYISEQQTAKATERSKRRGVLPRSRTHRHVDNILSAHVTFSKPQALARAAEPPDDDLSSFDNTSAALIRRPEISKGTRSARLISGGC